MVTLFPVAGSIKKDEDLGSDYKMIKKIGAGAYSSVWDAIHVPTGKRVAIKKETGVFEDLTDGKRLLREIQLLRNINHPNVVKLLKVLISPTTTVEKFDTIYLVLEIAEASLEKLMRSSIELDRKQTKKLMYNLMVGLNYIHSAGVLHRDLKPGNVLFNKDCSIRICDFGLARSIVGIRPKLAALPHQMSPKVAEKDLPMSSSEDEAEPMMDTGEETRGPKKVQRQSIGDAMLAEGGCPFETTPEKEKPAPAARPTVEDESVTRRLTAHVVTRWYRAPEIVLMLANYGPSIDVWSAGCIFAELLSIIKGSKAERKPLFPGTSCLALSPFNVSRSSSGRCSLSIPSTDQMCVILKVMGTPTEEDLAFIKDPEVLEFCKGLPAVSEGISLADRFPHAEKEAIDLLSKMLQFNPDKRFTVAECLEHPYFVEMRNKSTEAKADKLVTLEFDKKAKITEKELRALFVEQIKYYEKL